jgi:LPS-assembly lipoprotein
MWSAERSGASALVLVAAGLLLGGCFRPMYGIGSDGRGLSTVLASVQVDAIPDRLGHHLGQELAFELTGGKNAEAPRYRLTVRTAQSVMTPVVDSTTGLADAALVQVTAQYRLTRIATGDTVTEGTAVASAAFDRIAQRFAAARATRDAEIRAARLLAEQIKVRLAAVLASGP